MKIAIGFLGAIGVSTLITIPSYFIVNKISLKIIERHPILTGYRMTLDILMGLMLNILILTTFFNIQ
jgi:hypothetical protein